MSTEIEQPVVAPEQTAPVEPQVPKRPAPLKQILVIVLILLAIMSALTYGPQLLTRSNTQDVPTPTANPTPTPIRTPSAIASESAFMTFETSVASLHSAIVGFQPVDQTLIPPTFDLPLGF